ncbi:hypothetical protein PCL_12034 [Purpureocillium lilacinum]|uniref:RNase H type-1 domain-containing protein n=1 Tax=Purpureocillium lilacinum TaxID=33203 RepID=A0A2U3DPN4_PURLI|nr:hypothetical protein PCL_12034 [Purpureocillium lilacinum]
MTSNGEQAAGVKRAGPERSGKILLQGGGDTGESDSTGAGLQEGAASGTSQRGGDIYNEAPPSIEVWVKVFGEACKLIGLESDGCTKKGVPGSFEIQILAKSRLPAATCQRNAQNSELIAVTDQSQRLEGKRLSGLARLIRPRPDRARAGRNPGFKKLYVVSSGAPRRMLMPLLARNYHVLTNRGLFLDQLSVLARHLIAYKGETVLGKRLLDEIHDAAEGICCTVLEALFTTLFCHCRTPIPSSRGNPADSSQLESTKFQDLAKAHGAVQVLWIPGYAGIPGNEEADGLAKAGCLLPEPPGAVSSLVHLRRLARQQPRDSFKAWWTTEAPESYKPPAP